LLAIRSQGVALGYVQIALSGRTNCRLASLAFSAVFASAGPCLAALFIWAARGPAKAKTERFF